jgi:hypothetical protein
MFNVIYSIMDTLVLVFFVLLFCCRSMAPSTTTSFTLCSILEKDNLNGTNYMDWIHNLRIVLRVFLKNRGSKSTSKSGILTVYVMDILIADSFINS